MHLPNLPTSLSSAFTFIVFLFFDLLDALLCIIFRHLDHYIEGKPPHCYCSQLTHQANNELSETLFGRTNVFRLTNWKKNSNKTCNGDTTELNKNRWSDCGCHSCNAWINNNLDTKLHFVVRAPSQARGNDRIENVIFLHGFISSSSIWTESVFPHVSEFVKAKYRLIAVDLFGFGNSPKPYDSLYTLREHSDMIVKSVVSPLGLEIESFHLVAHSMGCTIALAVAAKYPKSIKSITLVAPPYLPSSKDKASFNILNNLAAKKLWPPLSFAASFMSWYEHLGRCVCFVICRNHILWEKILKMLKGDLNYMIMDLPKHTHHSAWHSMHNVVCGGAKYVDDYLDILMENGVKISVIQGEKDEVIPTECSTHIKMKVVDAEVCIIPNAGHSTVIVGREKEFTQSLEPIWAAVADTNTMEK